MPIHVSEFKTLNPEHKTDWRKRDTARERGCLELSTDKEPIKQSQSCWSGLWVLAKSMGFMGWEQAKEDNSLHTKGSLNWLRYLTLWTWFESHGTKNFRRPIQKNKKKPQQQWDFQWKKYWLSVNVWGFSRDSGLPSCYIIQLGQQLNRPWFDSQDWVVLLCFPYASKNPSSRVAAHVSKLCVNVHLHGRLGCTCILSPCAQGSTPILTRTKCLLMNEQQWFSQ